MAQSGIQVTGTKPSLAPAMIEGELRHVITIGGKPFLAHSTLKAGLCALVTAMALTGCSVIERHPVATGVVASVLVTSIALSANSSHHRERVPDVSAPLVACQPVSSCQ